MVAINICISQKHSQTLNAITVYRIFLKQYVKNLQLNMTSKRDNSESSPDSTEVPQGHKKIGGQGSFQ